MSTSVTEHLQCSQVAVSHIIGKGGLTIKKLTSDTNTVITIIDGKTPNPSVRIVGDAADVSKAAKLVQAIIDNQTAPDYCGPQGSVLRAEADAAGEARSRLMTEASALFKSDQKSEGYSTMALAKEQGEIMVAKHQQAANAILQYNNSSSGPDKLDLHGLRVAEAVEFTNQRLDALELLEEDTDLLLCPGAGHHSATGVRALRHACEELLRKRGLTYETQDAGDAGFMFNFGAKEAAIESPSPPSLKEESSSNVENHPFQFFSEVASLLKLTCSTTNNNEGSSNIWELNYPNHDFIEIPLLNISSDNSSGPSITGQTPHHMPSVVGGHYTSTPLSITSLYHRKAPRVDGLERVDMRATTDCQAVSDQGDHQGVTLDHSPIRSDRMDIIHGRYLGGLKVWSCAPDVARYVSPYGKGRDCLLQQLYGTRGNTPNSRVVVELGCGHALPIIAAMQTFISSSDAALKSSSSPLIVPEVTFYAHDYNWEVIEECVMPNILRNIPRHILGEIMRTTSVGTRGNTMVGIDSSVKATGGFGIFMGSGEWDRLILPSEYADVVLGADVTYDLAATTKFLTALSRILRPPPSVVYSNSNSVQGSCDTPYLPIAGGIAIVGTKEYYFGTNGGLQQMYEVIGQLSLPLRIEEIERYGACSMTRVLVVIKRV